MKRTFVTAVTVLKKIFPALCMIAFIALVTLSV